MLTRKRKTRKILAKTLAVSMIMSMTSLHSFADQPQPTVTETTVTNADGSETTNTIVVSVPDTAGTGSLDDPKITVNETNLTSQTSTTDSSGNKTVVDGYQQETVTTDIEATGTNENGANVTHTESSQIDTTTDLNGEFLSQTGIEEGTITETSEKTENPDPVTVILEEGTETSASSTPPAPVITGDDPKTDDLDQEYNQTVTTETPREVTANMGESSVTAGSGENIETQVDIGLTPIEQVWNENKIDVSAPNPNAHDPSGEKPDGYDFYYSGYGENSTHGVRYKEVDQNSSDSADVVQFQLTDTSNGAVRNDVILDVEAPATNLPDVPGETPENPVHTAYCVDLSTYSQDGWWYKINNLEDAGYYPDEDAENHIRAIVNNGYWGTESGKGSLSYIKDNLKDLLQDDPDALDGLTADDIDALTEGEAQTATQMAIWKYGNQSEGIESMSATGGSEADQKRINAIANYWMGLSEARTEENTTDVITAEKFIDEMSLTVGDKIEEHANNTDDDDTNDAYHVNLTFSLVVTPSERNDDLIVKIITADGNVAKIARLAGDDSATNYGTLEPDADGDYTLTGLELVEGSDVEFNLKLEGAQYLKEGVYIYTSQVKTSTNNDGSTTDTSSQTFVGVAGGYKAVDVDMKVNLNFNVEEGTIVKETSWKRTWSEYPDPVPNDPTPNDPPGDPTPSDPPSNPVPSDPIVITTTDEPEPVVVFEPDPVPLAVLGDTYETEVIHDDPVPLAVLPMTGDVSAIWLILSVLSGFGLAGLTFTDRKKKTTK